LINTVYQLVGTRTLAVKFEDISLDGGAVIVRPDRLAICRADQRYYLGQRDYSVLAQKLPMAPIHEASGTVVCDPTGTFKPGQRVALIPNIEGDSIEEGLYENYAAGSGFRSSGRDGFLCEFVALPPGRVVATDAISPEVAAITEFVSVAAHAAARFDALAHHRRERLAVIGDGSMAYVVAATLRERFPASHITVIGRHEEKLALFSFVDETCLSECLSAPALAPLAPAPAPLVPLALAPAPAPAPATAQSASPAPFTFDHAFECTGAEGSEQALDTLIDHIRPQGTILLLGVSERAIAVNTRMVLEKGLTLVGCSRSGRADFEQAVALMSSTVLQQRLRQIIYVDEPVHTIADIKRAFATDLQTSFKTVFEWRA
jgi:ribitol-5-phosphate 2-dehydrogenase